MSELKVFRSSDLTLDSSLKTRMGKTRFAEGSKYEKIYKKQKGICPICGKPIDLGDDFELHHIIPIKDGGTNADKNLVFLHKHCHKAKHKNLHYTVVA